jgi:hypothetical protein
MPFDRFKRVGPNAMRGRGIGTARGRATIMRGQPFISLSTHLLTYYIANGPLSGFPCIFLVANIVAFTSASWTRRGRTSTPWYSKMIYLIQPLYGKSNRISIGSKTLRELMKQASYVTISKALKTEIRKIGLVLCVRTMWSSCISFTPTTFDTEFWTCIYIS